MLTKTARRRSLAAIAGVTAGVASIVASSTAVNAQATDPEMEILPDPSRPVQPAPAPASHGICFSWTDVEGVTDVGRIPVVVRVPTTARGNNQRHCILTRGLNDVHGVFKLQDAINKCYPQFSAGVGFDGDYGPNTERAVRQIQRKEGVTVDGVYGPDTKTAMQWPAYRQSNGSFLTCALLRA